MHQEQIDRLVNMPMTLELNASQIDTFLQYLQLVHGSDVLIVNTDCSAMFNMRLAEKLQEGPVPVREASKLVPPVTDYAMGDVTSFRFAFLPIYLPGHYVSADQLYANQLQTLGSRSLRAGFRSSGLLRQQRVPR